MVTAKELVKEFTTAGWHTREEIEEFVMAASGIEPWELNKFVDLLANRKLSQDPGRQQQRLRAFQRLVETSGHSGMFRPMVKVLKTGDLQTKRFVASLLHKVNDIQSHDELCSLLRSKDKDIREAGAMALKMVGGKTVLKIVGDMVREPAFPGRKEAADVAANVGGHYSIGILSDIVKFGTLTEKISALRYLGDPKFVVKDPESARSTIKPLLAEPDDNLVAAAISSYCGICDEDQYFQDIAFFMDSGSLRLVKAALMGLKRFTSTRAMAILERKLRTGPKSVRMAVLDVLQAIGGDIILPPLVHALGHRQIAVRKKAADVLTDLSSQGKLDLARTIVWLLRSEDVELRRMAAELANTVRDPDNRLWPKLLSCVRDEDWWVRERVLDALLHLAGPKLSRFMMPYLQDPSDVIRRFGVQVLARLKDPKSVGALVRLAMSDPDWWVREQAVEAVAEINDPRTVPHLVHIMSSSPDMKLVCVQALGKMGAKEATPHVVEQLRAEDADIRRAALKALEVIGTPSQSDAVKELLADTDPRVRKEAKDLLLRWHIVLGVQESAASEGMLTPLEKFLVTMAVKEGDDLLLASDRRPYIKKMGKMVPLSERKLTNGQVQALILPLLTTLQVQLLKNLEDVDFSYEIPSHDLRFRVNVFSQRTGLCAVFRIIKGDVPELEKLGLPKILLNVGDLKNGLVLVGGPTGSGKSTTLAAIIDRINKTSARHVVTLEDPIEVRHKAELGVINQREIGSHTRSYADALRSTLRQDPNVILIGELRDLPTISFAVSAAETGHLVFGTVHTASAETSMDRIINAFPPKQQDQVRSMLAESLRVVLCQYLLKRKDGKGRVLAAEVMINNDAISNLIRKGTCYQIPSIIATSREMGMQLMDSDLMRLYKDGLVSVEEAYIKATNKKDFESILESLGSGGRNAGG
ncbi:MAG: PilT/PilU family type 4a pilus ATPase [Deltaproteobacteria bacterium]|nr:PilT/PilU family type 4a pilus ATPase [Deltaproteobacteria bacterium]